MLITIAATFLGHSVVNAYKKLANSEKELSFNTDTFKHVQTKANNTADDLTTKKNEVLTALDELRDGWKTSAGEYFFSNVDTTWTDSIDKFIATMKVFSDLMDDVTNVFSELETRIDAVTMNS